MHPFKRAGHLVDKCWKLHPELKTAMEITKVAQQPESEDEYLLLTTDSAEAEETILSISSSDADWVCDTGASSHICNDHHCL